MCSDAWDPGKHLRKGGGVVHVNGNKHSHTHSRLISNTKGPDKPTPNTGMDPYHGVLESKPMGSIPWVDFPVLSLCVFRISSGQCFTLSALRIGSVKWPRDRFNLTTCLSADGLWNTPNSLPGPCCSCQARGSSERTQATEREEGVAMESSEEGTLVPKWMHEKVLCYVCVDTTGKTVIHSLLTHATRSTHQMGCVKFYLATILKIISKNYQLPVMKICQEHSRTLRIPSCYVGDPEPSILFT